MTVDEFEVYVLATVAQWSYLRSSETIDKTDYAIKLRLHIDAECFVQIYANVQKNIFSYVLVVSRSRIYGRDNEGGKWHRHPHHNPESHDTSPEGQTEVALGEFLNEVQVILIDLGVL